MKAKIFIFVALSAMLAYGATVGDPNSFAKYGAVAVQVYDAGTSAPACVGVSKQNSVMVRNFINDAGTGGTMYCGFDKNVTPLTGMPVQASESLTIDVVALQSTASIAAPANLDGGVTVTTGTIQNQLCCIVAPGTSPTDEHWMIVK